MVRALSIFFYILGGYLGLAFLLSIAGFPVEGPVAILGLPGHLLWKSIHLGGLFLPLFLFFLGRTISKPKTENTFRDIISMSFGIFPAIFVGLALRIMFGQYLAIPEDPVYSLIRQMGQNSAILLLGGGGLGLGILLIIFSFTKSTKPQVEEPIVENPMGREEINAVQVFRAGVSGLLESKLSPSNPYPHFEEAPQRFSTAHPVKAEPVYEEKVKEEEEEPIETPEIIAKPENLTVFFSSDGNISDYPPRSHRRWTTVIEEEEFTDAEHEAILIPEVDELEPETPKPVVLAPVQAETVRVEPAKVEPARVEIVAPTIEIEDEEKPHDSWESLYHQAESEIEPEFSEDEFEDDDLDEEIIEASQNTNPPSSKFSSYKIPVENVLEAPDTREYWLIDEPTKRSGHILKMTLEEFGIQAELTGIRKGPVITMFEILPAPGVKLNRITNLSDNIALRLAAQSVRIVAPIPGKHAVGIEIPNKDRAKVSFSELVSAPQFSDPKIEIPFALGKDIMGEAQIIDLSRTPHLLIAGSTGSGKSVCVNALICSMLYRLSPQEVNLILIDPKIVELKFYNDIPHLLTPVITDPKRAFQALQWALYEMERRYSLLDAMQVRDIKSYNKKVKAKNIAQPHMPYLVIVIDEFADLMATSGKELEGTLARLAAMSRAVGIHLVLATQRPSTDVITGLIKANIPSRIAFMVASKVDSRIILDAMGADKLLGRGDMLFTSAWDPFPFRLQGAFLTEDEVERVVTEVKKHGTPNYIDDEIFFEEEVENDDGNEDDFDGGDDPLLRSAIDIVMTAKKASASYIQRRLKVGYNRAARMVEQMEDMGIVGPAQGSKPREVLRAG